MRDQLVGILDKADNALARCSTVLAEEETAPVATSVANARMRLSYPDDLIVVALAGGTGSGKSSLFNAITGDEHADVGGIRPTTGEPLAASSVDRYRSVEGYLDAIGIERRIEADMPNWLCLVDLPDTDSVEVDHRLRAEELLSLLDVVVWVVDPEKYRDAALHHNYLDPLSDYSEQFVFVLNQVDRLAVEDLDVVGADFAAALHDDGIDQATIVLTSVAPSSGPPRGVDDLLAALSRAAGEQGGVYRKLLVDLDAGANRLLELTGGGSVRFEEQAQRTLDRAVEHVASRDRVAATDQFNALIAALVDQVGLMTGSRIAAVAPRVPTVVDEVSASPEQARVRFQSDLIAPVRAALRDRAEANAALTELLLALPR